MKNSTVPLTLLLVLAACSRPVVVTDRGVLVPEDPGGNVTIYISNQDRGVDPLDVRVFLDGAPIIRDRIGMGAVHPSYEEYHFNWAPGVHEIRVDSSRVPAELKSTVEVNAERWFSVLYGYPPTVGEFTLQVHDEKPAWL